MANENSQRPVKQIDELLNNEFKSDIVFLVGLKAEKIFGHRIFLEVASDVFYAMFNHDDFSENKENIVKIPDVEPEIFLELLKFIYCKKTDLKKKSLVPLYAAADKYLIPDLQAICLSSIDKENVLWVFKSNSQHFNYEEIKLTCLKLIECSLFSVLKNVDLKHLDKEDIKMVLQLNKHRCTNDDLCDFLDRWQQEANEQSNASLIKNEILAKSVKRIFLNYELLSTDARHEMNRRGTNYDGNFSDPDDYFSDPDDHNAKASSYVLFKALKPINLLGIGVVNNTEVTGEITIGSVTDKVSCTLVKEDNSSKNFIKEYFFDKVSIDKGVQFKISALFENISSTCMDLLISDYYIDSSDVEFIKCKKSIVAHLICEAL